MIPNALERALQVHRALQFFAQTLRDDHVIMQVPDLYPKWERGCQYESDDYVSYGLRADGKPQIYRCMQKHLSQAEWIPAITPSLWKPVGFDGGYPLWVQPLGGSDVYHVGDKVLHNGVLYVSVAENNVWEPGVYGWEVTDA